MSADQPGFFSKATNFLFNTKLGLAITGLAIAGMWAFGLTVAISAPTFLIAPALATGWFIYKASNINSDKSTIEAGEKRVSSLLEKGKTGLSNLVSKIRDKFKGKNDLSDKDISGKPTPFMPPSSKDTSDDGSKGSDNGSSRIDPLQQQMRETPPTIEEEFVSSAATTADKTPSEQMSHVQKVLSGRRDENEPGK